MDEHKLITGDNIITKQMGGAVVAPEPSYVIGEKHEKDILEIFNSEINSAIINIKRKLGNDYTTTNKNAANIMNMLNTLQQMININTQENGTDPDQDKRISVTRDTTTGLYTPNRGDKYINDYDYDNVKVFAKSAGTGMQTLDTKNSYNFNTNNLTPNAADIQTRLNNCHILEMLYLIKHEEVMKTFAFTLNLFDKYKYSIKLLLFVLKYLVVKDPEKAAHHEYSKKPCVDVKLPKTLIPNIQTLLADQEKVQAVITEMKEQLETNPLGGENENGVPSVLNPAGGPDETELDKRLDRM